MVPNYWDIILLGHVNIYTYHFFCLGQIIKQQNKCIVYEQLFHIDWQCSWGFGDEDDEVKSLVVKLIGIT
jgi:hypothetical protein